MKMLNEFNIITIENLKYIEKHYYSPIEWLIDHFEDEGLNNISPEEYVFDKTNEYRYLVVIGGYVLSPSILETLSRDEDVNMRFAVATRNDIPIPVLERLLFDDEDDEVRAISTMNINTTKQMLLRAVKDISCAVRNDMANDDNLPIPVLLQLCYDEDEDTRKLAKLNYTDRLQ